MQTNIDHLCGKTIEYGDYLVYSFYLTPKLLDNAGDKFYKEIRQNPNYGKANFEKRYDCTFWTLDIIFADGSRLSEATDQYGIKLEVNQQYNSKTLFINQINYKCINLAEFSGKTIDKVIMTYPIDLDIRIADIIEVNHFMGDIVDLIDTRRGSNNTANCSRGNVFPVVSEPFGFLFGMPFTNSPGSNQPYIYSSNKIYGFGISHIYDYKIGDKEVISCFARQKGEKCEFSEFSHLNELARPYAYSVVLNNKVKVRMTVHKYTCLVEYDFTEAGGKSVEIIVTENLEKSFSYTEILGGTIRNIEKDGNKTIYTVEFKKKRKVVVNLTQSFISEAQAKFNYKKLSFSRCFLVLNRVWKKLLSKYTVGGTKFSLTQIFYSNIFRIHLYPNMLYEKTPDGKIIHPDIYNINDGKPAEGALMINNDFSKTYRLVWPAIFLFHSDRAGELLQNLWQNYSDSSKASQTLISSVGDDAENIYFNIILQLSVIYNIKNLAIENIPGPSAAHLEDSYNLDKQINEHLKKNNEHLKTDPFGLKGYPICEKKHILNLFGGEDNLAKALDNYFFIDRKISQKDALNFSSKTKSDIKKNQTYEKDIRFGLFSLEDCANHNIPFLYSYIKDVRKMQKIVSEIWYYLQVGADIGQGYFGDEDGGVMSAFYFFIGLGLYPLNPLSGEFVITAPRFPFCEIDLPNGRFIINAPLASRENCCVKSVKLNGELHKGITINYEEIKNGGYLELELEKY